MNKSARLLVYLALVFLVLASPSSPASVDSSPRKYRVTSTVIANLPPEGKVSNAPPLGSRVNDVIREELARLPNVVVTKTQPDFEIVLYLVDAQSMDFRRPAQYVLVLIVRSFQAANLVRSIAPTIRGDGSKAISEILQNSRPSEDKLTLFLNVPADHLDQTVRSIISGLDLLSVSSQRLEGTASSYLSSKA